MGFQGLGPRGLQCSGSKSLPSILLCSRRPLACVPAPRSANQFSHILDRSVHQADGNACHLRLPSLCCCAADEEELQGLDVSKHGERAFYAITDPNYTTTVATVIEASKRGTDKNATNGNGSAVV